MAWYLCPFSDFRHGGTFSKVGWDKQSKFPENVFPKFDCNAHLVGNYFLIWSLKFKKKAICCISCKNWLGWIPTVPICSTGPGFSEKKREREKEKDHTFTRASTWWHGWLTALLHSSSNSSIKIFMSLSVRRLLTYVTLERRTPAGTPLLHYTRTS